MICADTCRDYQERVHSRETPPCHRR